MNTRLDSALVIAAALSMSALLSLPAAAKQEFPAAFPVRTLTATSEGGEQIELGTSRVDVSWAMRGKRCQQLSPDVWVYSGYHADLDLANEQGCDTLIITFAHGQVASMRLVNKPAATIVANNLQRHSSTRNIASNE